MLACSAPEAQRRQTLSEYRSAAIKNLSARVKRIPKIARIHRKNTVIDFLDKIVWFNKSQALNGQSDKRLGSYDGGALFHLKNEIKQDVVPHYLITYNHRRNLLGIFQGTLRVLVYETEYFQTMLEKYPVSMIPNFEGSENGRSAILQLNDPRQIGAIYDKMREDKFITTVNIRITEELITPY